MLYLRVKTYVSWDGLSVSMTCHKCEILKIMFRIKLYITLLSLIYSSVLCGTSIQTSRYTIIFLTDYILYVPISSKEKLRSIYISGCVFVTGWIIQWWKHDPDDRPSLPTKSRTTRRSIVLWRQTHQRWVLFRWEKERERERERERDRERGEGGRERERARERARERESDREREGERETEDRGNRGGGQRGSEEESDKEGIEGREGDREGRDGERGERQKQGEGRKWETGRQTETTRETEGGGGLRTWERMHATKNEVRGRYFSVTVRANLFPNQSNLPSVWFHGQQNT